MSARQHSPALRKELHRLAARSDQSFKALRKAAEAEQGRNRRKLIVAELVGLPEMLTDAELAGYAQETVMAAYGAAHGLSGEVMAECFGCQRSWSATRVPGSFLKISLTSPDALLLSLLCCSCCHRPLAEVQRIVTAGVGRDFFGGQTEGLRSSTMAPGGRA